MADENPQEKQEKQEPLVKKDASAIREESEQPAKAKPKKSRRKRNKGLDIPEHTRITFLLFPPYGLAWLLTNKDIDGEMKKFGAIGMSIYLILWTIPLALLAYAWVLTNS